MTQCLPKKEVHAQALAAIVEERLATKPDIATIHRDIKELEATLQRDMKVLKTTFQRDMKDMEYRMTIRLGAMLAVSITIMGALVKLLQPNLSWRPTASKAKDVCSSPLGSSMIQPYLPMIR